MGHGCEELILQPIRAFGVFGHRLCVESRNDQPLVDFADLGIELFQRCPGLLRFFSSANGVFPKR